MKTADPFPAAPCCRENAQARFREDPLRILQEIGRAVKYGPEVEEETLEAMQDLAPLLAKAPPRQVFDELCALLPYVTAAELLRFGPILAAVIPEISPMIGFQQHSPHHAYDVFTHTAFVVEGVSGDLSRRWAALLHDAGKVPTFTRDETGRGHFYGHAPKSAEMADAILRRLEAPDDLREDVVFLIRNHMTKLELDKDLLRRLLSRYGWQRISDLLALQEADMGSKGLGMPPEISQFSQLRVLLAEVEKEKQAL